MEGDTEGRESIEMKLVDVRAVKRKLKKKSCFE